jgi:uncharacterized spore protein YtfJ
MMSAQTPDRTGAELVHLLADRIGNRAAASAVFGSPVSQGDTTVIPVARTAFGFGAGAGPGKTPEAGEGGGGGAIVKPIGYIEIRSDRTRFRRVTDPTTIMVAILGVAAATAIVARTLRFRR